MRGRTLVLGLLATACAAQHDPADASRDTGWGDAIDSGPACDGPPFEWSIVSGVDDGTGTPVVLLAVDTLGDATRLRLDTCPGAAAPCARDMIVDGTAGALARLQMPLPARGTLDVNAAWVRLRVADMRLCADCGGTLDVVAGWIRPFDTMWTDVAVVEDHIVCSSSCDSPVAVAVAITRSSDRVIAVAGSRVSAGSLVVLLRSNRIWCGSCFDACETTPWPTGIVATATGSFAPAP